MIRCLGVKVETPSHLMGDNLGAIQNDATKESLLKKKHVAVLCHMVREATAAQIALPVKIKSKDNCSDHLTKSLAFADFSRLTGGAFCG